MQVTWDSSLESGHDIIDSQHKELFDHINEFFNSIDKLHNHETVVKTLNFLVKYVKFHFTSEEELMKEFDYKEYKIHLSAHRKIVDNLMDCYKKLIRDGSAENIKDDITQLLQVWFVEHIMQYDQRLASFLKNNG